MLYSVLQSFGSKTAYVPGVVSKQTRNALNLDATFIQFCYVEDRSLN